MKGIATVRSGNVLGAREPVSHSLVPMTKVPASVRSSSPAAVIS